MSGRAQSWAKQVRTGSAARKALLMVMADEATDKGHLYGFGSVSGREWNYRLEHYAELAEMSRPTAYRHLAVLQHLELLVVDQQGGLASGGRKIRSKYRLNIPADFAVLSAQDSQSQNETNGSGGQSQNDTGTSIKMRRVPVSKRDTTQYSLPKPTQDNTPEASPPDVSAALDSVAFVLDEHTTVADLPVGDVKAILPTELQGNWPFSFAGFPDWLPVLSFALWADTCARNGKRIQPGQLPGMLSMVRSGAELLGITPAQYIGFHLDKGIRSFCQLSRTEVQNHFNPQTEKPAQDATHENSSSSSATDQNTDTFGDYTRFIEPAADGEGQGDGGADLGGYDEALPGEVVQPDGHGA